MNLSSDADFLMERLREGIMAKKEERMMKVYGSRMCKDCVELKRNFDHYHIEYEFLDINENLKTLKEFLFLRDTLAVFDEVKREHDIGLPALVLDSGKVILDWEGYLRKKGYEPLSCEIKSCSLNGKGC